jgi:hypothetical protein
MNHAHNDDVVTFRTRAIVRAAAAMLVAVVWIDGVGSEFHARAMTCCTHRQDCGGDLRAPDRCCEHMGHGGAAKTAVVTNAAAEPALMPDAFTPATVDREWLSAHALDVARLHDPPHLHTFALLI